MLNLKVIVLILCSTALILGQSSCMVMVKKDNGLHKGHYKSPNSPKSSKSFAPGKSQGKANGKPHGKFKN